LIGYYGTTTGTYDNWPLDGTAATVVLVPAYTVVYTDSYPDRLTVREPELSPAEAKAQAQRDRMSSFLASLAPSHSSLRRPSPPPPPPPDARQMVHKKRCFSRCGARRPRVRPM
jgi:hypothetical protein